MIIIIGSGVAIRSFQMHTASQKREIPISQLLTVSALGRLEPSGEIVQVSAPSGAVGARLEKLLVTTGDRVSAGQVLAILDSQAKYQAALEQAQSQVRTAEAQLEKVKIGAKQGEIQAQVSQVEQLRIERADQITAQQAKIDRIRADQQGELATQQAVLEKRAAEYRNAKADSDRFEQLYNNGGISASQRDSAKLKAETAQKQWSEAEATLRKINLSRQAEIIEAEALLTRIQAGQAKQINSAEATLDQISEIRPVDIEIAQAKITEAQANLRQAQALLETAYIRSPRDGQVLKIHTRAGEAIRSTGETLGILDLGQTRQMMAVAEVYDSDIGKIKSGQSAKIRAGSINETLEGVVTDVGYKVQRRNVINTDPTANIDARIIDVRIKLNPESSTKVERLTNLQVDVSIQVKEEKVK